MQLLVLRGDMIYSDTSDFQTLVFFFFILQDSELVTTILRKRNEEAIVDSSLSANTVATDTDLRAA